MPRLFDHLIGADQEHDWRPSLAAIVRERGAVEDELLWVLVTVRADIYRSARATKVQRDQRDQERAATSFDRPTN